MSAWKEMMTQEEAMNMSNEQAAQILIPMRNMMCDQNGCPISDAVFALDKAIESLSADVVPVRHGHWVFNQDEMSLHCSYCDEVFRFEDAEKDECLDFMEYAKYCLACGTRMDGESDE